VNNVVRKPAATPPTAATTKTNGKLLVIGRRTTPLKKERREEGVLLGTSNLTLENPEDRKVYLSDHTTPKRIPLLKWQVI
jgi:hypothetical protein